MTQDLLFPDLPNPVTQPGEEKPAPKGPRLNPDGYSVAGCSYIYAPRGQAGEYSQLSTNPYRGCGHKCAYCLHGDTLIQMADGTSKPIRDLKVGDEIVGVSIRGNNRAWNTRLTKTTVLAKVKTRRRGFAIRFPDHNPVICSEDHRWLTERGWKYTTGTHSGSDKRPHLTRNNSIRRVLWNPQPTPPVSTDYKKGYVAGMIEGDGNLAIYNYSDRKRPSGKAMGTQYRFRLALKDQEALDRTSLYLSSLGIAVNHFEFQYSGGTMPAIQTTSPDRYRKIESLLSPGGSEWKRGWLAGIFDAEGSNKKESLRISNTDPRILSMIEEYLEFFGFEVRYEKSILNPSRAHTIRILGGRQEVIRFWNLTSPAITRKFDIENSAVNDSTEIVSIQDTGKHYDMYDITTGTENFIANGLISHNCYVPDVLRMKREDFDAGAVPRPDFLKHLEKDARKYQALGIDAQVMLSFTTDPFNPTDMSLTRPTIEILKKYGLAFCTLTKGGSRALPYMDLFRPDRDAFASTLTSLDDQFSLKWERGAQLPGDRIKTLRAFHDAGIFTWVSLEPTLDVEASLQIVRETHEFVDLYKVGRVNYIGMTKTTDWETYTHRMIELLQQVGAKHYIKKDLQKYLPEGYDNPRYIPQHH